MVRKTVLFLKVINALTFTFQSANARVFVAQTTNNATVKSNGSCVYLRSGPSRSSRAITCLPPNTPVIVRNLNAKGFSQVSAKDKIGYIFNDLLAAAAPSNNRNPQALAPKPESPTAQAKSDPVKPESTSLTDDLVAPSTTVTGKQNVCLGKNTNQTKLTFYNSDPSSYKSAAEASMEGGSKTRFGELLNSVEQAVKNGRPVSLAMDYTGAFGKKCNQKERRCTLLIHAPGFDNEYPTYAKRFPNLPKDTFIGIVEDTGGAFKGKGTSKIDLAVRNRNLANGGSRKINTKTKLSFTQINNPCGQSSKARSCKVDGIRIEDSCQVAQNRTPAAEPAGTAIAQSDAAY